ncbi:MAG: serine hydrolase [Chitinophagales bacterium]
MRYTFLYAVLLFCNVLKAQTELDLYILDVMETRHISGVSACIIKEGKLAWTGNYGLANRPAMQEVDENTMFMLASISKTITATALMQLYDAGYFNLDDDINAYLPFPVHNPLYPDAPITFEQLLTHTSSIQDNWDVMIPLYVDGDSPVGLGYFMEQYLTDTGIYFDADNNYYTFTPGTHLHYSNIGASLCGYLVEIISGSPFNTYCNTHIFEPMCMDNTGWFLSELDEEHVAHPYSYYTGNYHDNGLYGYPDYPDGQLRTTCISLAKFLWMNMNGGLFDGQQILQPATVELMQSSIFPAIDPTQGLIWYYYSNATGTWWGHNGGDDGVNTDMFYNPDTQTGIIVLTNGDGSHTNIWNALIDHAATLDVSDLPEIACVTEIPAAVNNTALEHISISPNPVHNILHMQGIDAGTGMFIYDATGTICMYEIFSGQALDVSALPAGTYFMKPASAASGLAFIKW